MVKHRTHKRHHKTHHKRHHKTHHKRHRKGRKSGFIPRPVAKGVRDINKITSRVARGLIKVPDAVLEKVAGEVLKTRSMPRLKIGGYLSSNVRHLLNPGKYPSSVGMSGKGVSAGRAVDGVQKTHGGRKRRRGGRKSRKGGRNCSSPHFFNCGVGGRKSRRGGRTRRRR